MVDLSITDYTVNKMKILSYPAEDQILLTVDLGAMFYLGVGKNLLLGGDGNDQLIAGIGMTIMDGGPGGNGFDCGPSSVVLDYNPDNGDTVAGKCKIVNNVGIEFSTDPEFIADDNEK